MGDSTPRSLQCSVRFLQKLMKTRLNANYLLFRQRADMTRCGEFGFAFWRLPLSTAGDDYLAQVTRCARFDEARLNE
jgi:hypothetical protein